MRLLLQMRAEGKRYLLWSVYLCGGEPLEYPYIKQVVKLLKKYDIKIVFNTGLVSANNIYEIMNNFEILSLPLEGVNKDTVDLLRGKAIFNKVNEILDYYRCNSLVERPRIKIGTVVNKMNVSEVRDMFMYLLDFRDVVDIWRLYMFSPYGIGETNKKQLLIDDCEYNNAIQEVQRLAEEYDMPFEISTRSREENKGYCFIMDSQGNFYRYEEEYFKLGVSVFDEFDKIVAQYDLDLNNRQKEWQRNE